MKMMMMLLLLLLLLLLMMMMRKRRRRRRMKRRRMIVKNNNITVSICMPSNSNTPRLLPWKIYLFSEKCQRHLEFTEAFMGKRLMKHVIRNAEVMDQEFCGALCFMEHSCVSYNLKTTSKTGKHKCELNNATHKEEDLKENRNYEYYGAKVRASQKSDFNF